MKSDVVNTALAKALGVEDVETVTHISLHICGGKYPELCVTRKIRYGARFVERIDLLRVTTVAAPDGGHE